MDDEWKQDRSELLPRQNNTGREDNASKEKRGSDHHRKQTGEE